MSKWKTIGTIAEIRSPWVTMISERLLDDRGHELDYWRVEHADSCVAVTVREDHFVLPAPSFRPGLGRTTLDFPGGRVPADESPRRAAIAAVVRELGVHTEEISEIRQLNQEGWPINSSFSNQTLFGFHVELRPTAQLADSVSIRPTTDGGTEALLAELPCLQCRAVLHEWLRSQR